MRTKKPKETPAHGQVKQGPTAAIPAVEPDILSEWSTIATSGKKLDSSETATFMKRVLESSEPAAALLIPYLRIELNGQQPEPRALDALRHVLRAIDALKSLDRLAREEAAPHEKDPALGFLVVVAVNACEYLRRLSMEKEASVCGMASEMTRWPLNVSPHGHSSALSLSAAKEELKRLKVGEKSGVAVKLGKRWDASKGFGKYAFKIVTSVEANRDSKPVCGWVKVHNHFWPEGFKVVNIEEVPKWFASIMKLPELNRSSVSKYLRFGVELIESGVGEQLEGIDELRRLIVKPRDEMVDGRCVDKTRGEWPSKIRQTILSKLEKALDAMCPS